MEEALSVSGSGISLGEPLGYFEVDFGMKRQNSFDVSNPAGSRRIRSDRWMPDPTGLKLVPDCNPYILHCFSKCKRDCSIL
ncbi:hypothetical protein AVEN_189702-1 [Araneus ventricosus]|uniref:Uncharacterized protein n=1 Tax=Araneus ventricosus TaxID=182803 RepID=A0A4Y2PXU3_ARAVE|nr:hypothetical protein AVEN_189702-1 [Araneus ventricosus]